MEKFDLLGLTTQQQQAARVMILKEADTFTTDDTELGNGDTHKTNVQMNNQVAVEKNYNFVQNHFTKKLRNLLKFFC